MRVLYVKDRLTVHDRRFLAAILQQGHEAYVACLLEDVPACELAAGAEVLAPTCQSIEEQARRVGADVVHAGPVPTVGAVVAEQSVLPLVLVSWGSDLLVDAVADCYTRKRALLAIDRADVFIGDCEAIFRQVQLWRPGLRVPYINFPWGIELNRFAVLPRAEAMDIRAGLGWQDASVLVSTRSWEPRYGIDRLVGAFGILLRKNPNVRLILVGDGSMRNEVKSLIATLGLSENVCCPGRIPEENLVRWYCAADLYVSSAPSDGTSISLLEAMACGLPAVVHAGYGNLEWVEHGRSGWLVDCSDSTMMADGLKAALDERHQWCKMGARGRETAMKRADWASNSLRISEAYELAMRSRCKS